MQLTEATVTEFGTSQFYDAEAHYKMIMLVIGPILWGHSGPLCHALSFLSWTSMRRRRATVPLVTPGEWA